MEIRTILLVDDDPTIRVLGELSFTAVGRWHTLTASNGFEALSLARTRDVDVIVLDMAMPGLDGMTVLKRLKAQDRTCHIPVIMFTALSQESQVSDWLDAGAIDHIGKPFSALVLRARVRAALRDRH